MYSKSNKLCHFDGSIAAVYVIQRLRTFFFTTTATTNQQGNKKILPIQYQGKLKYKAMAENNTMEGELRRCDVFFVTYYWTQPAIGLHLYTNILLIIISLSTALFGSIANALVILSYFKNNRLRTLSNVPLLSLALSDSLVTGVVLPLHVTRLVKEIYGTHDCLLWTLKRLASYFSAGVSLLTVTIISIERFITLAYPFRYQSILTTIRVNVVVAATWLVTFGSVVANIGLIPYKVLRAMATSVVILCSCTMLLIWAWVYKLLRNHERRVSTFHMPSLSKSETVCRQETYRNTRTSGVIVTGLILCYLPLVLMMAYYWTKPKSFTGIYLVTPWGETIVLGHSLLNPLYVFWRKSEFRQTAGNFISLVKCRVQRIGSNRRNVDNAHASKI